MTFINFSTSRMFLIGRRGVLSHHPWPRHWNGSFSLRQQSNHSPPPRRVVLLNNRPSTEISTAGQFATSVKPHMTKSLFKWKKRKRKSKAQQIKELENLQRDMVKLLSKRAIQVVRDKSLLGAQRETVISHACSHLGLHDQEGSHTLVGTVLSSLDSADQPRSKKGHSSDYIAHAVEQHLQLDSTIKLSHTSKEPVRLAGDLSNNLETGSPLKNKGFGEPSLMHYNPIRYSEVFHIPHFGLKFNLQKESTDFDSAVKSFTAELGSLNAGKAKSSVPWDWDLDTHHQSHSPENIATLNELQSIPMDSLKTAAQSSLQSREEHLLLESRRPPAAQISLSADADSLQPPIHQSSLMAPMPSIFVHTHSNDMDEAMHQEPAALKPELPGLKKKLSKSIAETSDVLTSRDASSLESGSESISVGRELREMLDKSFVEACCFTGYDLLAVRNLQFYATKSKLTSVHMFNLLMHSLAKKGDLQTTRSLFLLLRQQGLEPNLQTYTACLECMGRMDEVEHQRVKNLMADIKKSNLDLTDIAWRCSFQQDEWDYVLKAIHMVEPDFVPKPLRFSTKYHNKLLLGLNSPNEQCVEDNQYAVDIKPEELLERAKQQLDLEVKGNVKVKSIAAGHMGTIKPRTRELRNALLMEWRQALLDSFEQKLKVYEKNAQDNINMTLYPFLKLFPQEEYVNIIFKCLKDLLTVSAGYSPTLSMIKNDLGLAVNRKFNTALRVKAGMDKKVISIYENYLQEFLDQNTRLDNHRLMWLRAMGQSWDTMNLDMSLRRWPGHITREVGQFLLDMILYDLKVNANTFKKKSPKRLVPAFCTMAIPDKSRYTLSELKLHPVVSRLFAVDDSGYFSFSPSVVPMMVPPVPWISRNTGSLLLGSNALVRMRPSVGHVEPLKWTKENRYSAVLDSLNTLSACAWTINKPILDLQVEIFNSKGDPKLKVAPPASELPPLPVIKQDLPANEKATLYKERVALQQQRQDAHGLWCTDLYRLSIANKFRDETFWFPHSMDFRGRTYPLPPHFNHLGSDNVRGMLLFAKGKPLGEKGFDWLKIHLINLTGLKKRSSNAERLEYANTVLEDILDSADKPLTGRKWWQDSDEPWQTLACCMEVAKIERFSGDRANYVCHFPVHQDGSCNGLQHYAAIGRDQAGAESVNLHPFDAPKDVYSDVVDLVEKARQAHAAEGKEIAQTLEGLIKRKVIKQTIMTTVYGVTKYGAREQIYRQLKDIPGFPEEEAWRGSMYLTQTTFSCLREMFTAAKDIQDWLTEASSLISAFMPVDWVTPLGFPVLQPYFKRVGKNGAGFDRFKPNSMKQKNAFPPNYIHSLDSTHMMLTALYCVHAGITFVSVHDCYWTHACDVPTMNKICREQFVNMHKQPLLEDLSAHLIALVGRANKDPSLTEVMKRVDVPALLKLLRNVPKRGAFDLDNVLKSTYFFS